MLLLEAGNTGSGVPYSHIPGLVPLNQLSGIDWAFRTLPQRNACKGLNDQVRLGVLDRIPRGQAGAANVKQCEPKLGT